MVGNACFMSVIVYMVSIWGGTEKYVIRAVQVMQNRAARCITKLGWYTPTKTLLETCFLSHGPASMAGEIFSSVRFYIQQT